LISKTQIDRLGERLRDAAPSEDDLRLLHEYRTSFSGASEAVVRRLQEELGLAPTARPAKSTTSVVDKLRRETIRSTQIQDIAGCRIVVADANTQNRVAATVGLMFDRAIVVDRRLRPSFGYRAVHIIPELNGRLVEIQLRILLQHRWAEFSEKLADRVGSDLKYGGGPADAREVLMGFSKLIAEHEDMEIKLANSMNEAERLGERNLRQQASDLREGLNAQSEKISAFLLDAVARL
jgi:ppGpp synthetase/RelA/SpoT-type nucleotidyltranferase